MIAPSSRSPSAEPTAEALAKAAEMGTCDVVACPSWCKKCQRVAALAMDSFALQREREALEKAAAMIHAKAQALYDWMLTLDMHSLSRKDKSLRAGELFQAAAAIRSLIPGSGEKERA